jgi:hypothetical protein
MYTGNFRGGTYVCNPDGSPAFSTRDAVLTIRNKEVVYDALNQPIACLHIKSISLVSFVASPLHLHHCCCPRFTRQFLTVLCCWPCAELVPAPLPAMVQLSERS